MAEEYDRGFAAGFEFARMCVLSCYVAGDDSARQLKDHIDHCLQTAISRGGNRSGRATSPAHGRMERSAQAPSRGRQPERLARHEGGGGLVRFSNPRLVVIRTFLCDTLSTS